MLNTIVDILREGGRTVSAVVLKGRLVECTKCEASVLGKLGISCSTCGCNMNIKARFIASRCPENRWQEFKSEDT
jgi:hypothetical protein